MPIWIVNILRQFILWVAKKYGKQILKKSYLLLLENFCVNLLKKIRTNW